MPCQSAATRTTGLVTQKDAIKASAKASCRVLAQIVKANQGVDNQDKIQLGIHINDTMRTPIPAPTTVPGHRRCGVSMTTSSATALPSVTPRSGSCRIEITA